ncbi:hypothetical protein PGT21_016182 [Puccinia graminis f. sp. tritici]|uniref:Uncharacterized protein n=1 Tax=Puccinia graminis f. sp. tritici TaxID=56615 RepID=A0A5B0QAQ5_PUCGR|nr:hypothetical protein PGT21_016182 [Puccinia graminis f. sp. tritici]
MYLAGWKFSPQRAPNQKEGRTGQYHISLPNLTQTCCTLSCLTRIDPTTPTTLLAQNCQLMNDIQKTNAYVGLDLAATLSKPPCLVLYRCYGTLYQPPRLALILLQLSRNLLGSLLSRCLIRLQLSRNLLGWLLSRCLILLRLHNLLGLLLSLCNFVATSLPCFHLTATFSPLRSSTYSRNENLWLQAT